jgi:predicted dehydrogenase
MTKIKLGIIGCGIAARELHLPPLQNLSDKFEITAVCNHTEEKAKSFSKLVGGVPYYLDHKEMLKKSDIDAVDITLPIELNYKATRDSLEAGKHVILEKPIASNLADAKKMLAFPEKYNRVMMIAENFRYQKVFVELKKILGQDKIGRVYSFSWNIFQKLTENNKYARIEWRKNHKYEGGFITDAGVHNFAAIRMLFGEAKYVNAFTDSINPNIGRTDTLSAQFIMRNNIQGVFNMYFSSSCYSENKFLIFGTEGTCVVIDNKITLKRRGNPDKTIDCSDSSGFEEEFLDFYSAVSTFGRSNKRVKSTFSEGYKDLFLIIKSLESAKTGKKVISKD